jgi:hypothetical protein
MIQTRQLQVPRAGDLLREVARMFDRHQAVASSMQDQARNADRGQDRPHVEFAQRAGENNPVKDGWSSP